jgi:FaeA-like protein
MRGWEPEFIQRWEAGETTDQIAAALGIAEGTARSRAYTLQQEGKIQPRPKGGKRVRSTSADSTLVPMQRPVQTHGTAPIS